jgi:predicted ATPase
LPPQPTPFFGRAEELAEVAWRLADPACRLLTLIGSGGIGKTRLALRAAENQRSAFLHGVAFAPLSGALSADFLVPALTQALGLAPPTQDDSAAYLLNFLREKELLLVLDSFEHLLAGRKLLGEILAAAPGVKLLVTSRERLNMQSEWVFALDGMPYPRTTSARPEEFAAPQFFLRCARRIVATFSPSHGELDCIGALSRLVDGAPLAIELCAAWIDSRSCSEMLQGLERDLTFLEAPWADPLERHRSLRATFEYSWALLDGEEREALARLSVFRGGFDQTAARQVAGASLPVLSALVNKSLLRHAAAANEQAAWRYELHDLIRQFAAEKLAEAPGDAHERYAGYYAGYLDQRSAAIGTARQHVALEEVRGEIDNVRAAYLWAIERRNVKQIGQSIYTLLYFYEIVGLFTEAERMFGLAVTAVEDRPATTAELDSEEKRVLGWALVTQGWYCMRIGRLDQAIALSRRSLDIARALNDPILEVNALDGLGVALTSHGDLAEAKIHLEQCAVLAGQMGHHMQYGALGNLGNIALMEGDLARARQLILECLDLSRKNEDLWAIASELNGLARIHLISGELDEAEALILQSLDIQKIIGQRWRQALGFLNLARIAVRRGKYIRARDIYQKSLSLLREAGDEIRVSETLSRLGEVHLALGERGEAKWCLQEALTIAERTGSQPEAMRASAGLAALLVDEGACEQATELLDAILSNAATEQTVKDKANQLRDRVRMGTP